MPIAAQVAGDEPDIERDIEKLRTLRADGDSPEPGGDDDRFALDPVHSQCAARDDDLGGVLGVAGQRHQDQQMVGRVPASLITWRA